MTEREPTRWLKLPGNRPGVAAVKFGVPLLFFAAVLFADLKHFRGVATRYCKLGARYTAFVILAEWYCATR